MTAAFRLVFTRPPTGRTIKRVRKLRGVRDVVLVRSERLNVGSPKRSGVLKVGAVKPLAFRPLAPIPTRAANFVWASLLQNESVLTLAAAQKLGVDSSTRLVARNHTLTVGAFADNGAPNVVDVLVSAHDGDELGLGRAHLAIIGSNPKANLDRLRDALKNALPEAKVRRITPAPQQPPAPQPMGFAEGGLIGSMTYRILKNGYIEPDPAWVEANIVRAEVPVLGTVMCHRLLIPQLSAALGEIQQRGLTDSIDTRQYGGCYVPRFIMRNPRRNLSMHAFGLAVDLNVAGNYYGTRGNMDPDVVAIFEKWGFFWGGRWSTPDPMHFELARLLQT